MIINKWFVVVVAVSMSSLDCLRDNKAQKKSENTFSEEANNFILQKVMHYIYFLSLIFVYQFFFYFALFECTKYLRNCIHIPSKLSIEIEINPSGLEF